MSAADARIFLLGASGWLGSAVQRHLPSAIPVETVAALNSFAMTERDLIVNAAGSKDPRTMTSANTTLVEHLISIAAPRGTGIIHLGSAAEYGVGHGATPLTEDPDNEAPDSHYGRSKLAATSMLRESGNACVLRLFNIADRPPQEGSPLADVMSKALRAARQGEPVELWAAGTTRDWISRDYAARSVAAAAATFPVGVFNVCSGVGVSMGSLAAALLARLDCPLPVIDLQRVGANTVVGSPEAWAHATGLRQVLTAGDLAEILLPD